MNNVNVKEVERFVAVIEGDAAEAKKTKCVSGSWVFEEGSPQFVSTLEFAKGNIVLKSELPPFAGGWGTSSDPVQYRLYGLAACFGATFAATAAGEGVELKQLEVKAENWLDLRKQMGLTEDRIIEKVKFTVRAEGASEEVCQGILKLTEERCPGAECLTQKIPLEVELKT